MFKIVRLVVKTSQNLGKLAIVEALYFLDLEIFDLLGLRNFPYITDLRK